MKKQNKFKELKIQKVGKSLKITFDDKITKVIKFKKNKDVQIFICDPGLEENKETKYKLNNIDVFVCHPNDILPNSNIDPNDMENYLVDIGHEFDLVFDGLAQTSMDWYDLG